MLIDPKLTTVVLPVLSAICTVVAGLEAFKSNSPTTTTLTVISGLFSIWTAISPFVKRLSIYRLIRTAVRYAGGRMVTAMVPDIEHGVAGNREQRSFAARPRLRNVGVVIPSGANASFTLTVVRRRRPRLTRRMSSSQGDRATDPPLQSLSTSSSTPSLLPPVVHDVSGVTTDSSDSDNEMPPLPSVHDTDGMIPDTSGNRKRSLSWPPKWLTAAIQATQSKYPDAKFEIVLRRSDANHEAVWRIKCIDCPGKLYHPGPGETLSNFEIHLKNRQHKQRVHERLADD
ncbi:swi-snf complex subunit [Moniliophthora roreri]|nr:swi-snf complex subunit [Moniliophthora roreri]